VLLAAIWGMSFLFIKVADEALAPLQVALGRTMFGAATLVLILVVRREGLPRDTRVCLHLAVAAVLLNVLPFSLFAFGETRTTSVLAGIWNATTPLCTLPIAMLTLADERATWQRIVGLVIGFAGVLVVLGVWQGLGGSAFIGNLACLAAAMSYGVGFPYTRRYLTGRQDSTISLAAGQLVCAVVEVAVLTPFFTRAPNSLPLKVVASVLVLGVLGTGIAYILNYGLIRETGATIASTVTYLIPLFSTVVGVVVLAEPLTWYEPIGALVVIAGVAISQGRLDWVVRTAVEPLSHLQWSRADRSQK
jgi:drug/metabolite transporter (DMT)-like permease